MKRLGSLLAATAVLAGACAPAIRTSSTAPAKPMPRRTIERQVRVARVAFDSAVRGGDVAAMGRWLADDAMVVRGHDTLRGRDAIVRQLMLSWPQATARLYFAPARTEYCVNGLYEDGGEYTAYVRVSAQREDTLRGRYALLWRRSGNDRISVGGVALAAAAERTAPQLGGCEWATTALFDGRRLRVSVFAAVVAASNTVRSLQDKLSQRGYGPGFTSTSVADIHQTRAGNAPWPLVSLRVRPWGGLSVEGLLVLGSRNDTVTGFNAATGSFVRATFSRSRVVAAVVGYEWHRVRAGAGPFFVSDTWSIREYTFSGSGPGAALARATTLDTWKERRTGLLLEASYTVPIAPYAFVEARAQQWSIASREIHPAGTFAPALVDTSSFLVAIAAGLALF